MKVKDVMTDHPICCLATDSAQQVASALRDQNIGSLPVVSDKTTMLLEGIITDRDLCCAILAEGLDPQTPIRSFVTPQPVTCREEDDIEGCELAMQEHQIRRIPVVDSSGACIGMVAQADVALMEEPEKMYKTVAEISQPSKQSPRMVA
jgi:CBS domain-containing protein